MATSQALTLDNNEPLTGKQRSLANLKPFPPGVSGNPTGRPKGSKSVSQAMKEIGHIPWKKTGRSINEEIALKTAIKAIQGDASARKDYCEYTEGRPAQKIQIDKQEIKLTGSIEDMFKVRELFLANKGVLGDTTQDVVVDVIPGEIVKGDEDE